MKEKWREREGGERARGATLTLALALKKKTTPTPNNNSQETDDTWADCLRDFSADLRPIRKVF
jgi:hypothetical protein